MTQPRLPSRHVHIPLCALLLLPLFLNGCSQSQMTNMWRDPSYNDGPMKKVLTLAVRKDPVRRRIWEDAFVQELKTLGVSAVASYSMFPSDIPDSSQVSEVVRKDGFDAVAISVRLPNLTHETYVAGYTTREPVTAYRPFLNEYKTYWKEVQIPGYTETTQVRRFQTNVWTTRNGGRLVWSGTVETSDAVAQGPVRDAIRKRIVAELVKAGLLPPRIK